MLWYERLSNTIHYYGVKTLPAAKVHQLRLVELPRFLFHDKISSMADADGVVATAFHSDLLRTFTIDVHLSFAKKDTIR